MTQVQENKIMNLSFINNAFKYKSKAKKDNGHNIINIQHFNIDIEWCWIWWFIYTILGQESILNILSIMEIGKYQLKSQKLQMTTNKKNIKLG